MTIANELTGAVALVLMLLICRGFAPHMRLRGHDPVTFLMQGIFIGSAVIAMRIASYDMIIPVLRHIDLLSGAPMRPFVEWMNTGFNLGFCFGAHRVLLGLHASLPVEDRKEYHWWSAPFYPGRLWFFWGKRA